jgi:Cytidylate kinase-like family
MRGVVTLSASYGARGDKVGRAVAGRLQLPFVDRAIPTSAAARQLGLPEEVGEPRPARSQPLGAGRDAVRWRRDASWA